MMKVARAEDQETGQGIQLFGGKSFDLARRRGETKTRTPASKVSALKPGRNLLAPGIIEIEVKHRIIDRAHEKGFRETRALHRAREQIVAMPMRNNHRRSNRPDERDVFCRIQDAFRIIAHRAAATLGTAWAFMAALAVIVIW